MKTVDLVCAGCRKPFTKPKKEVDRQRREREGNSNFYCSRQCFGIYASAKNLETQKAIEWRESDENRQNLKKNVQLQKETANPFRYYIHRIKTSSRDRNLNADICLHDLEQQWLKQDGKCAYTGIPMMHPHWWETGRKNDMFYSASIDRIDSSKGYLKENIHFVIRPINLAKSSSTDADFRSFLIILANALAERIDTKQEVR